MHWICIGTVIGIFLLSLFQQVALGATNYVSLAGSNSPPYDTWAKAATNIQTAIDTASSGDIVQVTNGHYFISTQIVVTNGIQVHSVNGSAATFIARTGGPSHRIFFLGHSNASIRGFTVTSGLTTGTWPNAHGGGVYLVQGARIDECVVSGCVADGLGGGIYSEAGGGFISNCIIINNRAGSDGGGIFCSDGTVQNCVIRDNVAHGDGGGVHFDEDGLIEHSIIENNVAGRFGGGILARRNDIVRNCLIINNVASNAGGGVGSVLSAGKILNSTIIGNSAQSIGGVNAETTENSIIYFNIAQANSNYSGGVFSYCCTTPLPHGAGNQANIPGFISSVDYHLSASSPCIDAGINQAWMSDAEDIDDGPRIVHGMVDLGAYEYRESAVPPTFFGNTVFCNWNVLPGERYRFERITDLQTKNWEDISGEILAVSTNVQISDDGATNIGFYRAVYLSP